MWPFSKKQHDWHTFNPVLDDRTIRSLRDALDFAGHLMHFSAFLRNANSSALEREVRRFFDNGFIGPITLTARRLAPSLQQIWHHNGQPLWELLAKKPTVNAVYLWLLMNEFYVPVTAAMPDYYTPIDIVYFDTHHRFGIVDAKTFAHDIAVESVLIDAGITQSRKYRYHLNPEWSIYEIEYAYVWNTTAYTTADCIKLNTDHLAWATTGGLRNFPKVAFNETDLDAKLATGTMIQLYVARDNGLLRNPVYDDLVYEVAKM